MMMAEYISFKEKDIHYLGDYIDGGYIVSREIDLENMAHKYGIQFPSMAEVFVFRCNNPQIEIVDASFYDDKNEQSKPKED